MLENIQIAGGSIIGYDHFLINKVNQDSYSIDRNEDIIIGVVCDGCGSAQKSEVGAVLGAKIVIKSILDLFYIMNKDIPAEFWTLLKQDILDKIKEIACLVGGSFIDELLDYFLFTILGVVITEEDAVLFSMGDGIAVLNGEAEIIESENNSPAYISYNLIDKDKVDIDEKLLNFKIIKNIKTTELKHGLIASDGLRYVLKNENLFYPGTEDKIPDISDFWENDLFFSNKDAVRRRLFRMAKEIIKHDWENKRILKYGGILKDDAALIAFRKN